MGGTVSKLFRLQFAAQNVLFVENLTQETCGVQFLPHKRCEFSRPLAGDRTKDRQVGAAK